MSKFAVGVFLTVGAFALLSGCDNVHAPDEARADPLKDYPQVVALEGLREWIVVSKENVNPGPPLNVQVTLRNKADNTERNVQYRFFFMANGRPENAKPDWHFMHMPARTEVFMQGNALDSAANDWRLEIRPAR